MMKNILICMVSGVVFAQVTVAVTPVEADDYHLRNHTEFVRAAIEDLLVNLGGIQIVERTRMDAMTQEMAFGNTSGLADNHVAEWGRMSGAQFLLTASILNRQEDQKGFSGYGVRTSSKKLQVTVRVRVYEIQSGLIVFSKTVKGEDQGFQTNFGGSGSNDSEAKALSKALDALSQDGEFREVFTHINKPEEGPKVTVNFEPIQPSCDLEINGVFVGNTPLTSQLVSGQSVTIRLSKAGYAAWEKTIQPRENLKVAPELELKQ